MSRTYRHGRPTIGVLAGWQFSWTPTPLSYLDSIFHGACLAAHDLGCNVLLGCGMGPWTDPSDAVWPAWPLVSSASDFVPIGPWNTDGLIAINPLHSQIRSRYLQDLIAAGHPVVYVGSGERGPTITVDNYGGILGAMRHLVEHGHRRIVFIAGSPKDIEGDTGARLDAYHAAVETHGLVTDPRLMAWGRHVYDGGYAAMQEILSSGMSFGAVLASNDESALGAMQALREDGRRIPQDVAIIGFDDRPESAVQKPALSSVRVPLFEMGYRAVESLLRSITGQTETIESFKVPARLMARESCGCSQTAISTDAASVATPQPKLPDSAAGRKRLVQTMAAPILAQAQGLSADEVEALCQRLIDAFSANLERNDWLGFQETLDAVLRHVVASGDDAHIWQAALSILGDAFERPVANWPQPAVPNVARDLLDGAHVAISASMQRQYRQHVVDQRWMLNRLGTLTARLLSALDEEQVYEVLAQHLPAMDIHIAWVAKFKAEGDDPVAQTVLHVLSSQEQSPPRFRTREFPPQGLLPIEQPFSLALFPLGGPSGQLGFVVFDTAHLDLYGLIVQQLATALNSAHLYREAIEGRRLAEEANELKSRFLSTVSHELRAPLNLIVGLSGMLLQESDEGDTPLPENYQQDIERIYRNGQHLGTLIGDVLDLASSNAGQLRLTNEFVDLSQALHLVADAGRQLAHDKGLAWHADLPESGPWVWGDRTRLRQVVLNLVNNAVKFTARGQVRLTLKAGSDSVTVAVCDTGLGIPPEEQQSIFDEFHRSERSIARGYGGLGLGLAICRRFVEMHGGTIGVRSSGEDGAGSTFYLTLPTVQPPAIHAHQHALSPLDKESVLVLTSRTGSGSQLCEHLDQRGFDVHEVPVHKRSDWQSRLMVSLPGAIAVDMSAAPHQGWEVVRSIKGHPRTQHLPVLLYSLSHESGSVLEFDYLTKPFELSTLARALDQHWIVSETDIDRKTILVVDDDLDTLKIHVRMVQAHSSSHRVLGARNGFEALDILQREHVDLVLLDLIMPELDGFDVLKAMREKQSTRETPVIVLTGQVLAGKDMMRLNRGVATVLSKGLFSVEETLAHVDTALARNRKLGGETQRLVRQAMAYVHEHYADPISRSDLARHVALSDDYLTFCFRKELGVTPIAYLHRYRVNQAKQLLTDTSMSITEIALQVGFSDGSYFGRIFQREVGVSPQAYRQA